MAATRVKETLVTPEFRLGFNYLFNPKVSEKENPKTKEMESVKEYSAVMIFDKEEDLSQMKALAKKVIAANWPQGKPKKFESPFVAGEDRETLQGEKRDEYLGKIVINAKNKFRQPGIVNEQKKPFIDEGKLYAGCYARAEVSCFAWTYMGKSGVSFGLENIMKVGDGERLSGGNTPDVAFGGVQPRAANNADAFGDDEDDDDEL